MAYPTGSGSEVLRRGAINAQGNSATAFTFDGSHITTGQVGATVPANHIIIMLTIIWCEMAGNNEVFKLFDQVATLIEGQEIPSKGTYIHNQKFALYGGDYLYTFIVAGGDVDIYYSYVDQNWS